MTKKMKDYLDNEVYDLIIDVREIHEYENGHVKGATNIPLGTINNYEQNKDKKIAVYCRSGHRSGIACDILQKKGYTDVTNIGGVIDGSITLIHD